MHAPPRDGRKGMPVARKPPQKSGIGMAHRALQFRTQQPEGQAHPTPSITEQGSQGNRIRDEANQRASRARFKPPTILFFVLSPIRTLFKRFGGFPRGLWIRGRGFGPGGEAPCAHETRKAVFQHRGNGLSFPIQTVADPEKKKKRKQGGRKFRREQPPRPRMAWEKVQPPEALADWLDFSDLDFTSSAGLAEASALARASSFAINWSMVFVFRISRN